MLAGEVLGATLSETHDWAFSLGDWRFGIVEYWIRPSLYDPPPYRSQVTSVYLDPMRIDTDLSAYTVAGIVIAILFATVLVASLSSRRIALRRGRSDG